MFECKYKYELEDSIVGAKYVYKSQKRKQDKIVAILIPILLVAMVAMLIWDIVTNKSFIFDIILIVALVVLEVLYILIPVMLVQSQKKSYKKLKLADMDYLLVKIDNNICTETMFKNGETVSSGTHHLKTLTSYLEDDTRIILVFGKVEYICLRKKAIIGGENKLKEHLQKVMAKNSK